MPTCDRSGIKPELRRTLGFLANFAARVQLHLGVDRHVHQPGGRASASAGRRSSGRGRIVILGQTFVALNFAELSSHFPVAGSIYQWSKRLSNRTLGWFTGWIYFWAGVHHRDRGRGDRAARHVDDLRRDQIKLADPSPIGGLDMQSFIGARRRSSSRR